MSIEVVSNADSPEVVAAVNADSTQKSETETKPAASAKPSEESDDGELDENADGEAASGEQQGKPRKKGGWQRRIERLERENALLREKSLATPQKPQEKPAAKVEAKPRPKADDFESNEDFVEALADWKLDERDRKTAEKAKKDQEAEQKSKAEADYHKKAKEFSEKCLEFAEEHDDYDEVMANVDDIQLSETVQDFFLSTENGHELAYELAKDPDELERICLLPEWAAKRALKKIGEKLAVQSDGETAEKPSKEKPVEKKEVKTSKAPPPIKPVKAGGGTRGEKSIYDDDIPFDEYERQRRKQLEAKASW